MLKDVIFFTDLLSRIVDFVPFSLRFSHACVLKNLIFKCSGVSALVRSIIEDILTSDNLATGIIGASCKGKRIARTFARESSFARHF